MKVIVCFDQKYGIKFNKRRVTRDEQVVRNIIKTIKGQPLYIDESSEKLFREYMLDHEPSFFERPKIYVMKDLVHFIQDNPEIKGYCFLETSYWPPIDDVTKVITYQWDREYPADEHFQADNLKPFKRKRHEMIEGNSHDVIIKTTYF